MRDIDYIIIGAGSAGGALVDRLSDRGTRVLLIEAGNDRYGLYHRVPAGSIRTLGNPAYDWIYHAEPDNTAGGRRLQWSGGKGLGGSSLINGMVYVRGSRHDYDDWAANGCPGWGFDDVLPFFRRLEAYDGPPSPCHRSDGPVGVSHPRDPHVAAHAFIRAAAELGLPVRDDYCGGELSGAFLAHGTIRNGLRSSTRTAYIDRARRRPNVEVITRAHAERILFEGRRATGVSVRRNGQLTTYRARREIIVSCGALQSPVLLMRSGIGNAASLKALGIDPLHDLPGVGQNLQDHIGTGSARRLTVPTYNVQVGPIDMLSHIARFVLFRRGPLASAAAQALAYFKSDPTLAEPDFALTFVPLLIDYNEKPPKLLDMAGVALGAVLCKPAARGSVRLRNASPDSKPVIDFPMLAEPSDLRRLIAALRTAERMWRTRALAPLVAGELAPMPTDDAGLEAYIRATCGIGYHASGTCRMGQGGDAVVDPSLRLRGVDGVRVIDASIMPRIVSGNTNAAVIMIGERGADLILRG